MCQYPSITDRKTHNGQRLQVNSEVKVQRVRSHHPVQVESRWTSWKMIKDDSEADYNKTRRDFAKLHTDKPQSFWKNVCWTDETKLDLSSKSQWLCSQTQNEAFKRKEQCIYCEKWRRLDSVLGPICCIWQSLESVQGGAKSQDYQGILKKNVLPSVRELGFSHRSRSCNKKMSRDTQINHRNILKWPHLNSIEHLWK